MNETLILAAKIACENHFHNIMARMQAKGAKEKVNPAAKMTAGERQMRDDAIRHQKGSEAAQKEIDKRDGKKNYDELKKHLGRAGISLGLSGAAFGATYAGSRALGYSKGRSAAHGGIAAGITGAGTDAYLYRKELGKGYNKAKDWAKDKFSKKEDGKKDK